MFRTTWRLYLPSWVLLYSLASTPAFGTGFTETFADDPIASGRWSVVAGDDVSRFVYQPAGKSLLVHYDTSLPTARLVRWLGTTVTEQSTFVFRVGFTLPPDLYASTLGYAQVAYGLLNSQTTGIDRAGYTTDPKAWDTMTFDYFPNILSWGGPSLSPTIINSIPPEGDAGFYSAFNFTYGPETLLNDPGESDLPRGTPLVAEIAYDGGTHRATLRVLQNGTPLFLDAGGGIDGDVTTITTVQDGSPFSADRFGILPWEDTAWAFRRFQGCATGPGVAVGWQCGDLDFDGDSDVDMDDFGLWQTVRPSVRGDVTFQSVEFVTPE